MQRNLLGVVIFILIFFSPSLFASETYILDPLHTFVEWHISHFGFSNPSGKWLAEGSLILDEKKPENSKVNTTIRVADMITGIPELDKHLKAPLFFDVIQFPTASFVSNKVNVTGKNTAKVFGILTVHGVSKPIILNVKLNKLGENPISNKITAGFSATTTLKRSDFGMTTLIPGLGDEVKINIETEAKKSD